MRGQLSTDLSLDAPQHTHPMMTTSDDPISVLCVDDDTEYLQLLETGLSGHDEIRVRIETDPATVTERLDGVDCVVSAYELSNTDGLSLLGSIRELEPDLPFVLHTTRSFVDVAHDLLDREWTDYVQKGRSDAHMSLVARRICHLVVEQRLDDVAHRYREALETSREPTVIVDPDGTIEYLNGRLLSELSEDRTAIQGSEWVTLFAEETVERLRSEALPVADDGWNWTGPATLTSRLHTEMRPRTTLSQLDDGSLVFAFHDFDRDVGRSPTEG